MKHESNCPSLCACPAWNKVEERWEALKPTLEFWYLEKKLSVPKLVKLMKENHNFDAVEHQYKHHFKKWGFKKNLTSKEKTQVERLVLTRVGLGRSSVVEHNGHNVDLQKIRRHAKNMKRQEMVLSDPGRSAVGSVVDGAKLVFGKNVFLEWNMPFRALKNTTPEHRGIPSPFTSTSPLAGLVVKTPPDTASPSHAQLALDRMTSDVMKRAAIERAQLFMQGRREQLLKSLTNQQTQVMSHWLYQFQMFAFTTAKYWGFGPRAWTTAELGFDKPNVFEVGPNPQHLRYLTGLQTADQDYSAPSQLCHWTIHTQDREDLGPRYENPWQPGWEAPPIQERLRDALEHTDFTKINPDDVPVAISVIAKKSKRSPNELLLESIAFAIMGRNWNLVNELLGEAKRADVPIHSLYPLHLAINYLDGSESCCLIFDELARCLRGAPDYSTFKSVCTNESGYTLLDSLMIAIVKSHTNLAPSALDHTNKDKQFPGEEVSICGRWDADSDCIRKLFSSGSSKIPFNWKHKFCHTSAQAVCHVIYSIEWHLPLQYLQEDLKSSGLFVKRCTNCGLKLELSSLHTLVYVAFLLAEAGCKDEDLFGMVACLLSLLSVLGGWLPTVQVSFALLFDCDADGMMDTCTHLELSIVEFADGLRAYRTHNWSEKCEVGWELFRLILDSTSGKHETDGGDKRDEEVEGDYEADSSTGEWCDEHEVSTDQTLGTIWAAVQTELLTYRRLNLKDPWVSEHFNMADLVRSLKSKERQVSIGLIDRGLMGEPWCPCGRFTPVGPASVEHAVHTNFSNLEHDLDRVVYLVCDEAYWCA